jgi:hypothetical protein
MTQQLWTKSNRDLRFLLCFTTTHCPDRVAGALDGNLDSTLGEKILNPQYTPRLAESIVFKVRTKYGLSFRFSFFLRACQPWLTLTATVWIYRLVVCRAPTTSHSLPRRHLFNHQVHPEMPVIMAMHLRRL